MKRHLLSLVITLVAGGQIQSEPAEVLRAIPLYTGEIYPTPQSAEYKDQFVPLKKVAIILGEDLTESSPPVVSLTERLTSVGAEFLIGENKEAPVTLYLGGRELAKKVNLAEAIPDQPESYLIDFSGSNDRTEIRLLGGDKLGIMWAVSSFNQLVSKREGEAAVRKAEVKDWPVFRYRGALLSRGGFARKYSSEEVARFATKFKMNWVYYTRNFIAEAETQSKGDKSDKRELDEALQTDFKSVADWLTPLGVRWSFAIRPILWVPKLSVNSPDDIRYFKSYIDALYPLGGELSIHFDDKRYPLPPADQERFGSAKEADIEFVTQLSKMVSAYGENKKLIFCPPFYWGPAGGNPYPESREEYLKAFGERVPPNVDLFWTGPRVKYVPIDKEDTDWITRLTQRKPVIWANLATAPHPNGWHYDTDPITAWTQLGYSTFPNDITAFLWNSSSIIPVLTLMDYTWNPKAYDAQRSIRRAVELLLGPGSYDALHQANTHLSALDPYGLRPSPIAYKRINELKTSIDAAEAAYQKALTGSALPESAEIFFTLGSRIKSHQAFVKSIESRPDLGAMNASLVKAEIDRATLEAKFDPEKDMLLSAADFTGGSRPQVYGLGCEPRAATWIYGAQSPLPSMTARFEITPFPPEGDFELIISGQDGPDKGKKCKIRIRIDDLVLFEGENPFVAGGWSRSNFRIPGDRLERQNTLVIENIEPIANRGVPPFFMLNYAVLRAIPADTAKTGSLSQETK